MRLELLMPVWAIIPLFGGMLALCAVAVACATNSGDPIVAATPDHPVSRGITDFARNLPGVVAPPVAPGAAAAAARRSLFGRRRKEAVR